MALKSLITNQGKEVEEKFMWCCQRSLLILESLDPYTAVKMQL